MRIVKHKVFFMWEADREEKWLNEMSAKGLQLCDVGYCRYTFEEGQPGEYIYRLELLDGMATEEKRKNYIHFVEDTGAEQCGQLFRWVYFRKKADGQGFDLFSDIDSRITQLNRICLVVGILSIVNLLNGINNLRFWFFYSDVSANRVLSIICLAVGVLIGCGFLYLYNKKRKLQKEKLLHE